MGIPSLNSAIFYNVSLFTLSLSRARLTLSFVSLVLKRQADYERASYCHFERAKRVEKSKSCKYNKYPELPSTKTALFMDGRLIFPFPSMKSGIFMDGR